MHEGMRRDVSAGKLRLLNGHIGVQSPLIASYSVLFIPTSSSGVRMGLLATSKW